MRLLYSALLSSITLLFSGCGTVTYERTRFEGDRVSNPTLGRGVYYQIPSGYSVLNPWSPVPPKPENKKFEAYLRQITANNDQGKTHHAFRETILFRSENRYLWIYHAALNLPGTFRGMHPGRRKLLMPAIAAESYRYFDVHPEDFDYTFEHVHGRGIIAYKPFRVEAAGVGENTWRGVGFTVLGDVTDITDVKIFAREADLPAAQADIQAILDGFSYGKPLP